MTVTLGPLRLSSPIIAASGTFGHGDEVARLCPPSRLGAVTVKSLAPFAWEGNPALRVTEAGAGGMLNSVGLAGPGVEAWIEHELPRLEASEATVIGSVWGRTTQDYAQAAASLRGVTERIVALEVNLSCPNLGGHQMFAQSEALTRSTVAAVVEALGEAVPVFAKLSANVTDVVAIARAALDGGATGLTLINTLPGFAIDPDRRRAVLGAGNGGLSGAPLKHVALRTVHDVTRALPGTPVIGTGGVSNGRDAAEMLLAGASAVGVGTATFAEPRAMLRIAAELDTWCAQRGVSRVASLTGALEEPRD